MTTTDPIGSQQLVYAIGPIVGVPSVKPLSDTRDEWTFPDGTVVMEHLVKHQNDQFDPKSCVGTLDESGTVRVVSGTGAYAHAQGHGTYRFRGHASSAPGTCGPNTTPTSFFGFAVASAEISV